MNDTSDRFYVITGGPGSGKTALLDVLRSREYRCSMEAGRGIIADQVTIDGPALPWHDPQLFAELMLSWELRSYHLMEQGKGLSFFDRGVPDVLGYLRLMSIPVPEHMHSAAAKFRYNRTVFIAPPWREIFRQDRERKQDFEEAVRTYEALSATYASLGYQLVQIPRLSPEGRAEFILGHSQ